MKQQSYDKYDRVTELIAAGDTIELAAKKEKMGVATYYAVRKEKENPNASNAPARKDKKSGKFAKPQPKPPATAVPRTLDIHLAPQDLSLKKVTVILCDADQLSLVLGGL